ncbi:transcriptional repressor [Gammaproteobacteria bacterium]|nr:transcriptional repressor [Gammaproteobacteria bacterium]
MSNTNLLTKAKDYCDQHGRRFTDPRKKVLEALIKADCDMGAYEILDVLQSATYQPKPPTIYRAIDFWEKHGFIHKINSLKTYQVCNHQHSNAHTIYLICNQCHKVQETHHSGQSKLITQTPNFHVESASTEIYGKCPSC